VATVSAAALTCLAFAGPASAANTGGAAIPGEEASDGPIGKAKLSNDGTAIPPADAPAKVVKAIEAANKIEDKPYKYGGGHGRVKDSGYDCSGAVSYALIKAGLLDSPLDSSGFTRWGKRGTGEWITVYGNPGHAYAVIAGLRWDTSMTAGDGPGWSNQMRPASDYKKTHPAGL
jgi:hypothetical protein